MFAGKSDRVAQLRRRQYVPVGIRRRAQIENFDARKRRGIEIGNIQREQRKSAVPQIPRFGAGSTANDR